MRLSLLGTAVPVWLIVPAPDDDDDDDGGGGGDYGAIGGMKIGKGNQSIQRKCAPMPLCPPQIPYVLT
jgi:hypothetical protein